MSLQWRHNDHDGVSNHQPHGCLLNRLFRRRSKKTSKLRVTGLYVGNSPGPVNSPHKGTVTRKMFPFDDVIMCIHNRHPYLAFTGELWGVYYDEFGEKWPCYNGTALYHEMLSTYWGPNNSRHFADDVLRCTALKGNWQLVRFVYASGTFKLDYYFLITITAYHWTWLTITRLAMPSILSIS